MYGRKKTANRRSYPPAIFPDANPRSRCVRDGRQYSAGGTRYLCQMVMRRCRDIDGWPGTRWSWRTGDTGNR